MRDLLAATAVAADLVLVPIQAKLEPLAFAVQTDSNANAPSQTTAAQSDQTPQRAALDAFAPSPSASGSGSDGDKDPAAVPPNSAAATETSADAICAALDRSASQNDLPLDFFTRLIWQESRFNPLSVSHAGAQGIAQFMPATARRLGLIDPFDPIQALPKSAELLRALRAQFGNLGLAAAAYNAGPKRVEDWLTKHKVLPQETEAYVRIITGRSAQEWASAAAGIWDGVLQALAPCPQLAKPVPHRSQPVIAIRPLNRRARLVVVARQPDRPAAAALQPHGVKLAHLESSVAAPKSIVAAPKSNIAAPKSNIAAPKSTIAAPKSIIAAPKSDHARARLTGSSSAHGSTAAGSHAPRREQPAASHQRAAPNPRTARVA